VLITSLSAARTMVISRRIVSLRRTPVWPLALAIGVVGVFALVLVVAPIVDASGLRDLTGVVTSPSGAPADGSAPRPAWSPKSRRSSPARKSSVSWARTIGSVTITCSPTAGGWSGSHRWTFRAPCNGSRAARHPAS